MTSRLIEEVLNNDEISVVLSDDGTYHQIDSVSTIKQSTLETSNEINEYSDKIIIKKEEYVEELYNVSNKMTKMCYVFYNRQWST